MIPRGVPELDLSNMVHGTARDECYSPTQYLDTPMMSDMGNLSFEY